MTDGCSACDAPLDTEWVALEAFSRTPRIVCGRCAWMRPALKARVARGDVTAAAVRHALARQCGEGAIDDRRDA